MKLLWTFDEAQHAFGAAATSQFTPAQEELYREFRAFDVAILAATQIPSRLPEAALNNSGIWSCHKLPDPDQIRPVLERMNLPASYMSTITQLAPGEGICFPGFGEAIPFKAFDLEPEPVMSSAEVDELVKPALARLRNQCVFSPLKDQPVAVLNWKGVIGERESPLPAGTGVGIRPETTEPVSVTHAEAATFSAVPPPLAEFQALADEILRRPQASKTEHYRNLGWGGSRAKRILANMLSDDLLRVLKVQTKGRPRELLELTEKGREVFQT